MKSKRPNSVIVNDAVRLMLDHIAAGNKRAQAKGKISAEPEVGIFFVHNGRLFIDGTPVSEGQPYGDFKGHATGHPAFWRSLQRNSIVPTDVEYDEVARGRVGFSIKERRFYVFVDVCIKKNRRMMNRIKRELNLPSIDTLPPMLDLHYRCPGCMKNTKQRKQEDLDWDF